MNLLSAENLHLQFGPRILLDGISFGIGQGQKVGLVGVNGCGKSTFLKILAGKDRANKGEVAWKNGLNLAYLAQKPEISEELTILEAVMDSDDPVIELVRSYESLLVHAETDAEAARKISSISAQMDTLNAWDYEYKAREILGKLDLHNLQQKVSTLSGGQQKRVGLAQVLLRQPELLILDEPTNHLDLDVIEWLEEYLDTAQMSLLMVTHDRYFLEKVTDKIIELDRGKLYEYPGNYSSFLEKKEERFAQQKQRSEKARNLLRKELDWLRRQPKARGTKAKYRVEGVEKLRTDSQVPATGNDVQLGVQERRLGGKILELRKIRKSYNGVEVIRPFSYIFRKGEKLGIAGSNGSGKTTFLEMISGRIQPDDGEIIKGKNTHIGYFRQEEPVFENGNRVIDIVSQVADVIDTHDGNEISASQMLLRFSFTPEQQYDLVDKLSGGEKRRLQLLLVLISHPNFLILDEPTNDLDLITLRVLEDFLSEYSGCVVIVSHDRYFMNRIADHIFIFDKDNPIRDFNGKYMDYRIQKKRSESTGSAATKRQTKEKPKSDKKLTYKEKREMEQLENELEILGRRKKELESKLNSGQLEHDELMALSTEHSQLTEDLDMKEYRWLELSEKDQ